MASPVTTNNEATLPRATPAYPAGARADRAGRALLERPISLAAQERGVPPARRVARGTRGTIYYLRSITT
jgi:hypothetical protein